MRQGSNRKIGAGLELADTLRQQHIRKPVYTIHKRYSHITSTHQHDICTVLIVPPFADKSAATDGNFGQARRRRARAVPGVYLLHRGHPHDPRVCFCGPILS